MQFNWLILLLLVGCGSGGQKALREYRDAYMHGEWDRAAGLLKKSKLEKDKDSRLLWLMEQGRLAYGRGDYPQAIASFTAATELIDAQYTKSISKESSKWIVNEASGEFFGAPYERSWLFYHLAMSHWRYYQEGTLPKEEARRNLFSARAALLAWDSFFQDWQRSTQGKTIYRHDLTAKVVAGEVHEATGERADQQIALQLYKDAWKLLDTVGPSYAAFNSASAEYTQKISEKLLDGGAFAPVASARSLTPQQEHTRDFLRDKILSLTWRLRPGEIPQVLQQLGLSKEDGAKAKELKATNVVFVLEEGTIPAKDAEEINLGIQGLANLSTDPKTRAQIAQVGSQVMATFAVEVLGLTPKNPQNVGTYVATRDLTAVAIHEAAIAFQVPVIPPDKTPEPLWLVVKGSGGTDMLVRSWPLITPLEEVARQSLNEEAGQRILRTGVRVAGKHLAAILASFALYQQLKGKNGENAFLAKMAAMGSYVAATKGIAYSERADTRAWATLPRALRVADASLPPGSYEVSLARKLEQNAPGETKVLGQIEVAADRKAIFTYLLPQM
jgi:hypothetical protein